MQPSSLRERKSFTTFVHRVSNRFLFNASSIPDTRSSAVRNLLQRVAPVNEPSMDLNVQVLNRPFLSRLTVVSFAFVPCISIFGKISCHVYSTGSLIISKTPSYRERVRMLLCADDKLKSLGNHPPTSERKKSSRVDFPQPGGTLSANISSLSSIRSCKDPMILCFKNTFLLGS